MSASPVSAGFQVDQWPLRETAQMLRRLARTLTLAALQGSPRPNLTALLTNADVRSLTGRIYAVSPLRALATNPMLRAEPLRAWRPVAKRLIRRRPKKNRPRNKIAARLALSLGAGPGEILPDVVLPLTAAHAWDHPPFQREIATVVDQHLRNHIPMDTGTPPVVTFSHGTFWLLIAMCADAELLAFHRRDHRARFLIAQRFRQFSASAIPRFGWAGYWDQWLLASALSHWPAALRQLPSDLARPLEKLPLVAQLLPIPKPPETNQRRLGWPGRLGRWWLPRWQGLWRLPPSGQKQEEPTDWVRPDWRDSQPSWQPDHNTWAPPVFYPHPRSQRDASYV